MSLDISNSIIAFFWNALCCADVGLSGFPFLSQSLVNKRRKLRAIASLIASRKDIFQDSQYLKTSFFLISIPTALNTDFRQVFMFHN